MPKAEDTAKKYLGVTLKENTRAVREHAKKHQWSLSKAADDLILAGAEARGVFLTNIQTGAQQ